MDWIVVDDADDEDDDLHKNIYIKELFFFMIFLLSCR